MRELIQELIVLGVIAVLTVSYVRISKRRWNRIIDAAVAYHRYHFIMIQNEPGINSDSKEIARALQMILDRQFKIERRTKPGLGALWLSRMGNKSSVNSLDEIFVKLFRDRYFGHGTRYDERLDRLYITLSSMIYRFYFINSIISLPVLLYMDLKLGLSFAGITKKGPDRLFRDIARSKVG